MVLDTLEIRFEANMGALTAQLTALTARISSLPNQGSAGGAALAEALAGSIRGGVPQAAQARDALWAAASPAGLGAGPAYAAGAALSQGLANGILSRKGAVLSAARSVANAAAAAIRAALGIHSPSKVAYGMGENFSQGFSLGVSGALPQVAASARALSAAAADSLSGAGTPLPARMGAAEAQRLGREEGNLNLTVPINVDGVKLGEAAIRGINAVTRLTGKMQLEI